MSLLLIDFLSILVLPITGGIIAYSTNWLAIRMLFRPHRALHIFGIRVPFTPGLIVREQARLAKRTANAIGTRLLTPEMLANELSSVWTGWDNLEHLFGQWGLAPPVTYAEKGLNALRTHYRGKAVGEILPTQLITAVKSTIREYLPQGATYIQEWPQKHPEWDAQLSEWVQKIVQENVGKFFGLFVDHKKVYANIKEGLLEYLAEENNIEFIANKIDETIDQFCEYADWDELLFSDTEMLAQKLVDGLENILGEAGKKAAIMHAFGGIAIHIAKHMDIETMIENRINAFSSIEAEALIMSVVRRELHLIMALGGLLGFIIGWIPVIIG